MSLVLREGDPLLGLTCSACREGELLGLPLAQRRTKSTSVLTKIVPFALTTASTGWVPEYGIYTKVAGEAEEDNLSKSPVSQGGLADLHPQGSRCGVGSLCHLPSVADLESPTHLLLSALQVSRKLAGLGFRHRRIS